MESCGRWGRRLIFLESAYGSGRGGDGTGDPAALRSLQATNFCQASEVEANVAYLHC